MMKYDTRNSQNVQPQIYAKVRKLVYVYIVLVYMYKLTGKT